MGPTDTNTGNNASNRINFLQVSKQLGAEFMQPVEKYTSLYLLTLIGIFTNLHIVVESILNAIEIPNPPKKPGNTEANKEKITHIFRFFRLPFSQKWQTIKSCYLRLDAHFSIIPNKKYYNPFSFLVATVTLMFLLTSSLQWHKLTASQQDRAMKNTKRLTGSWSLKNPIPADSITKVKADGGAIEVDKIVTIDYFKTLLPVLLVCLYNAAFSFFLWLLYRKITSIEFFIAGLYITSVSLLPVFYIQVLVNTINNEYFLIDSLSFILFFAILPGVWYSAYLSTSKQYGNPERTWLRWVRWLRWILIPLAYIGILVIIAFVFVQLLASVVPIPTKTPG